MCLSLSSNFQGKSTSDATQNQHFCHCIVANCYVPLVLLQHPLRCLKLWHSNSAIVIHHTSHQPTPIIMLLSLRAPVAVCDPRVWAPQGSCPHVVLSTTTPCCPTSSPEVHEHSWHNRHPRHPCLHLLELPLSQKPPPCLSSWGTEWHNVPAPHN